MFGARHSNVPTSQHPNSRKWIPALIVALTVAVQVDLLFHETRIGQDDLNDSVFHLALAERAVSADNPLDFWVPEWTFGYAVLRTYQPLGTLFLAGLYLLLGKSVPMVVLFAWVKFLLLIAFPITVFFAARMIGLTDGAAAAAAAIAPWVSTNGLYGIEYGSYLWRGSGLYSQLLASHLFLLAIGFAARAFRGERTITAAGAFTGLTFLAHFIYGHMAALTIVVLAVVFRSWIRLVWIGAVAFAIAAFQLLPMLRDMPLIARSRWEEAWKWDSFGAARVLGWLFTGELLDHGRLPVITALAATGAAVAFITRDRMTRLIAICGAFWIVIFFGRPTLGPLLTLLGFTDRVQLHRVIGGAHIFLILLGGVGLAAVAKKHWIAALIAVIAFVPMFVERREYLRDNKKWGEENFEWLAKDKPSLDAALAKAASLPGRTYAGLGAQWGKTFRVGYVPVYAFISRAHIPAVSYLYHAMAKTSDVMVLFDDTNPRDYERFAVGSVIAPIDREMPQFLREVATFGRFRVLQYPNASYFGTESPTQILFKMTYHPNWRATVDGVEGAVRPAADGFTAIEVTPGTHAIQMNYRPGNAKYALLAAGILVAIFSALVERSRRFAVALLVLLA
jgi:hypothetical protein